MTLRSRLAQVYFDLVYNPIYDFTTAKTSSYHRLQGLCVDKLKFEDGARVLCVGVGTGNEILRISGENTNVSIWGVDSSSTALRRASSKASNKLRELKVFRMDAEELQFEDESFDTVLCLHLMGFLCDDRKATAEIIRVLKREGQFVITYPSGNVELKLGSEIAQSIRHNLKSRQFGKAVSESLAVIGGAIVNTPITLFWEKPREGFYSHQSLRTLFAGLNLRDFQIEEDIAYQEFIVYGRK